MLWIVTMALLVFASAKPTHGPLGVRVKEAGRMRIGVEGSVLQISGDGKCTNKFIIWYPVTKVNGGYGVEREGYCPCVGSKDIYFRCVSSCPLKKNAESVMEIDVDEAPQGCIVTIKNAFLAPKDDRVADEDTSWIVYVVFLVSIGILLFLMSGVVAWFYMR